METLLQPIQVSLLAMTVIFLVLGILIGVIKLLVYFFPYQEPPAPPLKAAAPAAAIASGTSQEEDHIAAIHAALAHHLGQAPQNIHIVRISSL